MPNVADPKNQCPHRVHPTLISHLSSISTCPPCTLQGYINIIKSVQEALTNRGGIFVSRPHIKRDPTHPEWSAHLGLRERWRDTKIKLLNEVMLYEQLARSEERGEGWEPIDEALQLWDKECEAVADMPGYGKAMTEEDVGDIVRRMIEQLKGTVEGLIKEHEDEQAEAEGDGDDCPFPDSDVDTDSEDEDMPDTFPDEPQLEDVDPSEIEAETETAEVADTDMEEEVSTPPSTEESSNETGPSRKRKLRFTDSATVCPDSLTFVPSLFPHITTGLETTADTLPIQIDPSRFTTDLSTQPTFQPHRRRTEMSNKRLKSRFGRHRSHYSAGKWASPAGYEKPNTSFYKLSWEEAERTWADDDKERKAEKRTYKKLKGVSGTWVLMRVLTPALWSLEESLKGMRDGGTVTGPGPTTESEQ